MNAFPIVSGFVILYFSNYLLDNEIWWLIPVILFGLGYGLLLRILGFKIRKPLIGGLLKHKKNRTIVDKK